MATRPETGERDHRRITLPSVEQEYTNFAEVIADLPSDASRPILTDAAIEYILRLETYRELLAKAPDQTDAIDAAGVEFRIAYERVLTAGPLAAVYNEVKEKYGYAIAVEAVKDMAEKIGDDFPEHAEWAHEFADSLVRD